MRIVKEEVLGVSSNLTQEEHLRLPTEGEAYKLIVDLLMRNMYSNPTGACVRELVSNAMDANVEAGRGSIPIEVTLNISDVASNTDLYELRIRDFGLGITPDKMSKMVEFGYSTKREGENSDNFIGAFGVGLKSLFNVSEQAFIKSYTPEGKGYEYIGYRNEEGNRVITLLNEFTYSAYPLGTEIKLVVDKAMSDKLIKEVSVNCCWFRPSISTNIGRLVSTRKVVQALTRHEIEPGVHAIYNPLRSSSYMGVVSSIYTQDERTNYYYNNVSKNNDGVAYRGLSLIIGGVPYYGVWDSTTLEKNVNEYVRRKGEGHIKLDSTRIELILEVPITVDVNLNSNRETVQMTDKSKATIQRLFEKAMDALWERETSIGKNIEDVWQGVEVVSNWWNFQDRIFVGSVYADKLSVYISETTSNLNPNCIPVVLNTSYGCEFYFTGSMKELTENAQDLIKRGLTNQEAAAKPSGVKRLKIRSLPITTLKEVPLVITNIKSSVKIRKKLGWSNDKPFMFSRIEAEGRLKEFEGSKVVKLLSIPVLFFEEPVKTLKVKSEIKEETQTEEPEVKVGLSNRQKSALLKTGFFRFHGLNNKRNKDSNLLDPVELQELPSKYLISLARRKGDYVEGWNSTPRIVNSAMCVTSLLHPNNAYVVSSSALSKLQDEGIYNISLQDYCFNKFVRPFIKTNKELSAWFFAHLRSDVTYAPDNNSGTKPMINLITSLSWLNNALPGSVKKSSLVWASMMENKLDLPCLSELSLQTFLDCLSVGLIKHSSVNASYITLRPEIAELRNVEYERDIKNICLNPEHPLYALLYNLNIRDMDFSTFNDVMSSIKSFSGNTK